MAGSSGQGRQPVSWSGKGGGANGVSSDVSAVMGGRMSEPVSTRMRSCGRRGGIAGAALLVFVLAASPSWAVSCDGYVGGPDEATALTF